MLIDRLSNKNKILILKYLIQTYYNNDCKFKEPYVCDIITFFDSNLIYNNRDIHFNKKSSKKIKLKDFILIKNIFVIIQKLNL